MWKEYCKPVLNNTYWKRNIYIYIYIYRSQTPKNTRAHSTPFWYLMVKVVTHSGLGHWRSWSILYISFGPGNEIASSLLVIKLSTHQTDLVHSLADCALMFHRLVNWCANSVILTDVSLCELMCTVTVCVCTDVPVHWQLIWRSYRKMLTWRLLELATYY